MGSSADAVQRVEDHVAAFSAAVERCSSGRAFVAADWQDAYNRLARLRDRYIEEKPNLKASARDALAKVFEHDTFTEGMLAIRQVAEHVSARGEFVIRTMTNAPITLDVESSALAVFSSPIVNLNAAGGSTYRLDHLQMLREMERRIRAAMRKV